MRNREWLPHVIAGIALAVFIVLGLASATQPTTANLYRPLSGIPDAFEIGAVQTNFDSTYPWGNISRVNVASHAALLRQARLEHGDAHIDVVNITWNHIGRGIGGFRYSARGTVITFQTPLEGALGRTVEGLARYFPAGSRIAIAHVLSADRGYADLVDGRLEHFFRIRGFDIFDRSQLDIVRAEQQLGLDFVIDDHTAVSIGRITGVSVIITGRVVIAGNLRELQFRAVDTTTARLIGTTLERF